MNNKLSYSYRGFTLFFSLQLQLRTLHVWLSVQSILRNAKYIYAYLISGVIHVVYSDCVLISPYSWRECMRCYLYILVIGSHEHLNWKIFLSNLFWSTHRQCVYNDANAREWYVNIEYTTCSTCNLCHHVQHVRQ